MSSVDLLLGAKQSALDCSHMEEIHFWIGIIATIAFAITGVLAIADRGVDIFGVLVLGVITAIGGGTVRDIILGTPTFWSQSQSHHRQVKSRLEGLVWIFQRQS